jgi:hypothetical protein
MHIRASPSSASATSPLPPVVSFEAQMRKQKEREELLVLNAKMLHPKQASTTPAPGVLSWVGKALFGSPRHVNIGTFFLHLIFVV